MPKITLMQMASQWRYIPHQFDINLWNFEVEAGKLGRKVFQASFDMGRFNDTHSTPWAPRKRHGDGHPILFESGTLKNSIKWKQKKGKRKRGVTIFTDKMVFMRAVRHRGFCYAAIHNDPDSTGVRTGRVANMPQRQFMGDSDVLAKEIEQLDKIMYKGFP